MQKIIAIVTERITDNPEVNFRNQAIAQLCAFHSPFLVNDRYGDLSPTDRRHPVSEWPTTSNWLPILGL